MAHNGKTISLGEIIWKVLKNPLAERLTYEEAAEFAIEFIRLVGAPLALSDTNKILDLHSYKALLPDNLTNIKSVKYSTDRCFHSDECMKNTVIMRYASDTFHVSLEEDQYEHNVVNSTGGYNDYTYIVQKNILQASIESGFINISYKSIAVDEEGFPLVPDDERFKFGLEYFILFRYLEPMWMIGKITDKVFSYIEQKKLWYMGSANNSLQMPSPDQMETIMNGVNRIIIQNSAHAQAFKNYGIKEQVRKYN